MSHPGRELTSLASAQPSPAGAGHQEVQYYIVVVVVVRSLGVLRGLTDITTMPHRVLVSTSWSIMLLSHWAHTLLINCLIIPHQSWSSKDIDKYLVDNSIPILCRAKPLLLIMINHDCLSAGRARCVNLKGGHPAFWDGTFQEFRSFRIQAAAVAAAYAARSQQVNASPTPRTS